MSNILAGISFPFRSQGKGLPQAAFGTSVIRSALIGLLRTKKRSRVMNPNVGTNLHKLIFEDQGPITRSLMIREISSAVASQLPMVVITNIQFKDVNKVTQVNIQYNIQGIADQTGFVSIQG